MSNVNNTDRMTMEEAISMLHTQLRIGGKDSALAQMQGAVDVSMNIDDQGRLSSTETGLNVRVILDHWSLHRK